MKANLDDLKINEAIETYPLEPLPSGFVKNVLKKTEPRPAFDPNLIIDANTRFLFTVVPVAIILLGITTAFLIGSRDSWMGPITANYLTTMFEYSKIQLSFDPVLMMLLSIIVILLIVVTGYVALWQLTDPKRKATY
ncbi:MAG: hypothetical protein JEZ06_19270 [Anaerolineaceae bacterium]|nr:hypothetical protein [Anaerolineaceae bacterium]